MSARAILCEQLKIVEIPMPYHEREGESKLKIGKDGVRFLRVILQTAFLYRPSRPLGIWGFLCLLFATTIMLRPTIYWAFNHKVLDWMIYRFVVSDLLGSSGVLLLSAAFICRRIVSITLPASSRDLTRHKFANRIFASSWSLLIPIVLMALGAGLVLPSLMQLIRTGSTYEHWSRFLAMSFLFHVAFIHSVTMAVNYCLTLLSGQLHYLKVAAGQDDPLLP